MRRLTTTLLQEASSQEIWPTEISISPISRAPAEISGDLARDPVEISRSISGSGDRSSGRSSGRISDPAITGGGDAAAAGEAAAAAAEADAEEAAGGAEAGDSATGEAVDPAQVITAEDGAAAREEKEEREAREDFCGGWTNIRSAYSQ